MRNLNLIVSAAGIAVSAIFGIGAANAADLPARTYTEAPVIAPVTLYNWTGCYLGGYVGGARQSRQVNAWDPTSTGGAFPAGTFYNPIANNLPANTVDAGEFNYDFRSSVIGGGTLGCNWQGASPFVFGIEGEGGYMKVSASAVSPYSSGTGSDTIASTRIGNWYASVAGRFGATWDRVLVYFKGGVGFSNIKSSEIDACTTAPCSPGLLTATGSSNRPFWVAGVGVEYAFNNNWSVKGEFLVLGMYQKYAVCGPGAAAAAGSTFCGLHNIEGVHTFKVGVNYYFNTLARTYTKAPPMIAAAVYDDWRGFYVGGNGGYGSSLNCFETLVPRRDKCITATGGLAGGQIGYRWQSSWWVFGLEAQGDWANLSGSAVSKLFPGNSGRARIDGIGLFTGQVSYAWNSALLYVKGGAAVAADRYNTFVTATNLLNGTASETRWGGTVGAGVEFGFAPNWSVAVEYDHLFMGTRVMTLSVPAIAPVAPFEGIHQNVKLATARVNYRWGAPVVAKY
jgi:outer membrane immunogenic protein